MADSKLTGLTEISALAIDDHLYVVDKSDTTDDAAGSSRRVQVDRVLGFGNPTICYGRLTLESGVPISVTDQTAKTNVFFTPFGGNRIAVYDGTRWELYTFSELTLALGTLTNALPYDVFIHDNAGTLTLSATAWTNTTTRATALTTQDGVYVKSGSLTHRYLGTFYTASTTTTEDSNVKRFLYNQNNKVARSVCRKDTTNSWTYAVVDTWRQANAVGVGTANQVEIVVGLLEHPVSLKLTVAAVQQNGAGNYCCVSIGEDSTTAPHAAAGIGLAISNTASAIAVPGATVLDILPSSLGYHKYTWLELTGPSGTGTFYSESGGTPELRRSVLCGFVMQ